MNERRDDRLMHGPFFVAAHDSNGEKLGDTVVLVGAGDELGDPNCKRRWLKAFEWMPIKERAVSSFGRRVATCFVDASVTHFQPLKAALDSPESQRYPPMRATKKATNHNFDRNLMEAFVTRSWLSCSTFCFCSSLSCASCSVAKWSFATFCFCSSLSCVSCSVVTWSCAMCSAR